MSKQLAKCASYKNNAFSVKVVNKSKKWFLIVEGIGYLCG